MPRESQRRFKHDAVDAINKSLKVRFTKIQKLLESIGQYVRPLKLVKIFMKFKNRKVLNQTIGL